MIPLQMLLAEARNPRLAERTPKQIAAICRMLALELELAPSAAFKAAAKCAHDWIPPLDPEQRRDEVEAASDYADYSTAQEIAQAITAMDIVGQDPQATRRLALQWLSELPWSELLRIEDIIYDANNDADLGTATETPAHTREAWVERFEQLVRDRLPGLMKDGWTP